MKKHIFIFRHGQTDWNKENRIQGQQDIPLNDEGKKQADQLAEILKPHQLEHILCSDLQRTRQTAHPLIANQKVSISYHQELREFNAGIYQGRTKMELANDHVWQNLGNNPNEPFHSLLIKDGESRVQLQQRMITCIQSFVDTTSLTKIGISTHGFAMKLFLMDINSDYRFTLEHIFPNTHIVQLTYDVQTKKWEVINGHEDIPSIAETSTTKTITL